jgi:acyl-CoA synthetase (AMP-forming)/AMP-acid ligase II
VSASKSVASILWEAARRTPDAPAIAGHAFAWPYGRLAGATRDLVAALQAAGIAPGSAVALLCENSPAFVAAHYALSSAGAVVAPVNHNLRGRALQDALETGRVRWVVASRRGLEAWRSLPARPEGVTECLVLSGKGGEVLGLASATGGGPLPPLRAASLLELREDEPALQFLSSGTTGRPKAIRLSHRQALAGLDAWADRWSFEASTRSLMVAPFFHVVYDPLVLGTHRRGGAVVLADSPTTRGASAAVEALSVTDMMGTPAFFVQLLQDQASLSRDLTSLRSLIYGAAPTPVPVIQALRGRFPGARLYNCYGLTETASAVSCLGSEELEGREASVGRPHSGVEVSIRDEERSALPAGQTGEVFCRGPNVIDEYYSAHSTERARFHEGWLATGDIGYLDPGGYLYLLGRRDDVINVSGEKIYPCEVENAIHEHPDVLEAAVSVVEDPVRGQAVRAHVVPREGRPLDLAGLRRFCRDRLPACFVPRQLELVAKLPRNASGKLVRTELVAAGEQARDA